MARRDDFMKDIYGDWGNTFIDNRNCRPNIDITILQNEVLQCKKDLQTQQGILPTLMKNVMENNVGLSEIKKEVKVINDNTQTNADVINLFKDVDTNRTNLEDKLNNLEQSTNNRLDKLEESINQLINMLQKS